MRQHLLILDVDETLVYADEKPLDRPSDFRVGPYEVYRRPFLDEFLSAAGESYELAVWSSASASYVFEVVSKVFGERHPLKFVWTCDRCTRRFDPEFQDYFFAKNLSKVRTLGYALEQVLILDDSPEKVARHYGNHLRVRPFTGDPADSELRDILPFLTYLRDVENVRVIEKRDWRRHSDGDGPPAAHVR